MKTDRKYTDTPNTLTIDIKHIVFGSLVQYGLLPKLQPSPPYSGLHPKGQRPLKRSQMSSSSRQLHSSLQPAPHVPPTQALEIENMTYSVA